MNTLVLLALVAALATLAAARPQPTMSSMPSGPAPTMPPGGPPTGPGMPPPGGPPTGPGMPPPGGPPTGPGTLPSIPPCPVCVPPPPQFTFSQFRYGGTGCPQGTTSINLNPERTVFTVLYDQFVATLQPGGNIADTRKNCGVNFLINVPPGFQCAILFADWRGFVQLDAGLRGNQRAIYYLAGSIDQRTLTSDFVGPISQSYLFRDVVPEPFFSPCGQSVLFNINSANLIQATAAAPANARGLFTTDSTDGKIAQNFGVVWRRC